LDQDEVFDSERDTQFDDFPPISEALIAALNKRMPERWPNQDMPDRSIWIRSGQLQVVELLEFVRQRQRAEDIKDNINVHRGTEST